VIIPTHVHIPMVDPSCFYSLLEQPVLPDEWFDPDALIALFQLFGYVAAFLSLLLITFLLGSVVRDWWHRLKCRRRHHY
jgi:hypothetical protein